MIKNLEKQNKDLKNEKQKAKNDIDECYEKLKKQF